MLMKFSFLGTRVEVEAGCDHQGFQYYLQQFGGQPVDVENSLLKPGDVIAVNWNSGNTVDLPPGSASPIDTLGPDPGSWMNLSGNNRFGPAGYYSSNSGPVPFVIGDWRSSYFIAKVVSRVQYSPRGMREEPEARSPENPEVVKQMQMAGGFEKAGQLNEAVQCNRRALDLDPTNAEALNSLAWILATASDPDLRDTPGAVQLALEAAKLTQGRQPVVIGTLAAAFAENGAFAKALTTARMARDLARLTGQNDLAARNEERMHLYASGGTVSGVGRR